MSDVLDHIDLEGLLDSFGTPSHLRAGGRRLLAERLRHTCGIVAPMLKQVSNRTPSEESQSTPRPPILSLFRPPKPVERSSGLTRVRRQAFLKPEGRDAVVRLSDEVVARATIDPDFPIDQCAVHAHRQALFCYSSGYFRPPRAKDPESQVDAQVLKAIDVLEERGRLLGNRPLRRAPRAIRHYRGWSYRWMKVVVGGPSDGSLVSDFPDYPLNQGDTGDLALDLIHWVRWAGFIDLGPRHKVATYSGEDEVRFAVRDPYHLIVQQLAEIPDPEA